MTVSGATRRNHDQLFGVLGSQALQSTIETVRARLAGFETRTELAASRLPTRPVTGHSRPLAATSYPL